MENSDQFIENLQHCRTLRANRENFENQRSGVIQDISRFIERVGRRKGEISIAEGDLLSTLTAIRENSAGVISFGVNAFRRNTSGMIADVTTMAVRLSNAEDAQREKIRRLRQQLAAEEDQLQAKREKQAAIEARVDDIARRMTANNCSM